jgi:hypothetical protein
MVMKNFLIGLSKFVLGIILSMLIVTLAGASMARYFMTRMVEQPERPIYENDDPDDQRPNNAKLDPTDSTTESTTEKTDSKTASNSEPAPAKPKAEATPKPEPEDLPEGAYRAYASTNLNLRSGPGTSYDSIGGLGLDEKITVLEEQEGWLKVKLEDNSEGWVSSAYVVEEE